VSSKYVTERQDFCQEIIFLSFFSYFYTFFQKIIVNLKKLCYNESRQTKKTIEIGSLRISKIFQKRRAK